VTANADAPTVDAASPGVPLGDEPWLVVPVVRVDPEPLLLAPPRVTVLPGTVGALVGTVAPG